MDPTSLNKQGNDRGTQYRTGVYYTDESEKDVIQSVLANEQKKYTDKIVIEVMLHLLVCCIILNNPVE